MKQRQSIGGAGYSAWSNIPFLIKEYSPVVTFEGDNTLMSQQSFNYLQKMAKRGMTGKDAGKFDSNLRYLNRLKEPESRVSQASVPEDFLNLDTVNEALQVSLLYRVRRILEAQKESTASNKDFVNSLYGIDIVKASEDNIRYISFQLFMAKVTGPEIKCPNNRKNLKLLCLLYGLSQLYRDSSACFESGYFNADQKPSTLILEAIKIINNELRPQILNILECYEIDDCILNSAIGNSYGDIYETHLEWAKNSRMNDTKLGDAIPDGYMEYIMPIVQGKL